MQRNFTYTLLLLVAVLFSVGVANAQNTLSLSPSKDNSIFSENNNSNGAGIYLFAGRTQSSNNGALRRGLIQFDLSQIPAGATITNAELKMTGSRQSSNSVSIHRLTTNWGEGTADASGQEGRGAAANGSDATWNFSFFNETAWTTAGGDFVANASATTSVNTGNESTWSGAQVLADVQAWYDGDTDNFGWIIIGDETNLGSAIRMNTKENTSGQPKLIITYTEPEVVTGILYEATLTGRNEVNPATTLAYGKIQANLVDDTLIVTGSFAGLSSALATDLAGGAHIHLGYAGQNGGIELILNPTINADSTAATFAAAQNTFAITAEQLTALNNRQLYVNVHSQNYRSGEIRGQLLPLADTYYAANLFGSYEVPVVMTQASGSVAIELNGDTMILTGSINNLEGDFAAEIGGGSHIHLGYAGQNGPVEIGLMPNVAEDLRSATFSAEENTFILTQQQMNRMGNGRFYINIHTQKALSGEIRGQIVKGETRVLSRAHLSGTNEVPITTTTANGMMIAEVLNDSTVRLSGAFNNLEGNLATDLAGGAHLHSGMAGQAGPIIVPFDVNTEDMRSGFFGANHNEFVIGTSGIEDLLKRGTYANIHSLANMPGELRGQFLPEAPINFTAFLSGIFEVPEVSTDAFGAVKAELQGNRLIVSGAYNALGSPLATDILGGAHIHLGLAGATGAVELLLASTLDANNRSGIFEAANNTFELTEDQVAQLKGRQLYINIHSEQIRSGELRGQILNEANAYYVAPLSGASEVPAVNTPASGMIVVELNGSRGYASGYLSGLTGAFATDIAGGAHIHNGLAGQNGGIAQLLNGIANEDGTAVSFAVADNGFELSNGFIDTLSMRMNYVNIHSATVNSGEIRGQLLPLANQYFTVTLSGANEVPAISSTGVGAMIGELIGKNLTLSGAFSGLEGTYAADINGGSHVHLGQVGTNGGIEFVLNPEIDADELGGIYMANGNQFELTDEQLIALKANDLYVNIHSNEVRSGELRGQLLPEINRFPTTGAITFPAEGASIVVEGSADDIIAPTWSTGTDRNKLGYTWELAIDTGFVFTLVSQNVVSDTTINLSLGLIDSLLRAAELPVGFGITLYHRVITSDGNLSVTSPITSVVLERGTVTSINNLTPGLEEFVVFPTVTTDQVNVRVGTTESIRGKLLLVSPMGRVVTQRMIQYPSQSTNVELVDVSNLPAGNYYLSILNNGSVATRMIIVK